MSPWKILAGKVLVEKVAVISTVGHEGDLGAHGHLVQPRVQRFLRYAPSAEACSVLCHRRGAAILRAKGKGLMNRKLA